jgi:hypothetical protein
MHPKMKHLACWLAVVAVAWLTTTCGCSRGYQQETAHVRGTVKLDGKLISGGSVMFVPNSGRGAVGVIDSNGGFVLGTYESSDGAIVGKHKVAVFPMGTSIESDELPSNYVPIPTRYQNGSSSGIEVEVKRGEENRVELNLVSQT